MAIALVRCNCVAYIAIVGCGLRAIWAEPRGRYEFLFLLVAFHLVNLVMMCIPPRRLATSAVEIDTLLNSTGDVSQVEEYVPELNWGDITAHVFLLTLTFIALRLTKKAMTPVIVSANTGAALADKKSK